MKNRILIYFVGLSTCAIFLSAFGVHEVLQIPSASAKQRVSTVGLTKVDDQSEKLDQTDLTLFTKVSRLYKIFETETTNIWDGSYRLDQDILYLVRKDAKNDLYGYVINHPNPDAFEEARRISLPNDLNLPPVYRIDKLDRAQLAESPNFAFDYSLGSESVMMMKYTTPEVDDFAAPSNSDWSLFLAHEVFHRYQEQTWRENDNNQDLSTYDFSAEPIALILLEQQILKAAINASSDVAAYTEALKQFTAVRSLRIDKYGDQIKTLDNEQERIEGTSLYIEHQVGELLQNEQTNLSTLGQNLLEEYTQVRASLGFDRFYETGAVLSYFLDQTDINWHDAIKQGDTPYDLLDNTLNIGSDQRQLVNAAKKRFDFAALLQKAERLAEIAAKEPSNGGF